MTIFSNASWGPVKTVGRYALTAVGSGIAVLGALGLMSQTDAASATQAITRLAEALGTIATSIATLAGIVATIYAAVRGTLNSTTTGVVASTQALIEDPKSPVKGLVIAPTVEGFELKQSIPGPGIVLAGTPAAEEVIKP